MFQLVFFSRDWRGIYITEARKWQTKISKQGSQRAIEKTRITIEKDGIREVEVGMERSQIGEKIQAFTIEEISPRPTILCKNFWVES